MNEQTILSREQANLHHEIVSLYGLSPDDITFFTNDPKPFLSYEATCIMCNLLTDLRSITIEPIETHFADSLSLKCTIIDGEGRTRSAVGVANTSETINEHPMSPQQIYQTASARAIRNTLRTAGIDLIKLHLSRQPTEPQFSGPAKSNFASLLAQAHALGAETGLITSQVAWSQILQNRYNRQSSNLLSEEELADFVAFLRTLTARKAA